MRILRKIIAASVFRRLPKAASMDSILAAAFHRGSSLLYLIYCIWAVLATLDGVPSLAATQGVQWTVFFAIAVFLFAAPACFGATFWPSFARLELFAGSAFVVLMALYVFFIGVYAAQGEGSWAGVAIVSSIMVISTIRVAIVIMFLLRQAAERREKIAAYMAWLEENQRPAIETAD